MTTTTASAMRLVSPAREYLDSYLLALKRGWSRDNMRPESGAEERARIESDADGFIADLVEREAAGRTIAMPDGSQVPRLPGYALWLWDGEFCGSIDLRWQPGSNTLPPYCLGHIGYGVVPWKQGRGYATQALRQVLPHAAAEGLTRVEITTSPDNLASRKVIEANGGVLVDAFTTLPMQGSVRKLRFHIAL